MSIKAPLFKHIEQQSKAIILQHLEEPFFDPNWHFHPHYQLFTVIKGEGTRLIGDSIQPFIPGDTVFLGPDIPHLWRCDPAYFQPESGLTTNGIVLYFKEDFLGDELLGKAEMAAICKLLQESPRGYTLQGNLKERVQTELICLSKETDFLRLIRLLRILQDIATSTEKDPIASLGYQNTHKLSETERMQKVHNYLMQHFKSTIRLKDVSEHAGMSEAAFCRYFKTRTGKTLTDFVAELRIGHACKLLIEDQWSISQIAYESGFDTLSNFNRYFKKITEKTPREYKKDYSSPVG